MITASTNANCVALLGCGYHQGGLKSSYDEGTDFDAGASFSIFS